MKFFIALTIATTFISCNPQRSNTTTNTNHSDTIVKHDTVFVSQNNTADWQQDFGLTNEPDQDSIWGKPVSYYIEDNNCVSIAVEFYYGNFRPSDNGATDELLKYACTNNAKLRPYYRWCLEKTIQISDGALSEHIGIPARRYAEKYPAEFFKYIDTDTIQYNDWTEAIAYSGYYDEDDYKQPAAIRSRIIQEMKKNCGGCRDVMLKRIEKFAVDCFE